MAGHVVSVAAAAAVLPHPATVLGTPSSTSRLLVYWPASQLINSKLPALGHLVGDGGFKSTHWRWMHLVGDGGFVSDHWRLASLVGNGCSLKMDTPGWGWWPDWRWTHLVRDDGFVSAHWRWTCLVGDGGLTEVTCSWLGMVAWLKMNVLGWELSSLMILQLCKKIQPLQEFFEFLKKLFSLL